LVVKGRTPIVPLHKPQLPVGGKAAKSTFYVVISLLQIPSAETTIDLGVARSGCRQCWGLNQVWFFQDCDIQVQRNISEMKYHIQLQQQLAKTLTFIFISVWNKRHPQAEQAVSYKPPAHKAAVLSLLHRASLHCFVITDSLLIPLSWEGGKCQWADGAWAAEPSYS